MLQRNSHFKFAVLTDVALGCFEGSFVSLSSVCLRVSLARYRGKNRLAEMTKTGQNEHVMDDAQPADGATGCTSLDADGVSPSAERIGITTFFHEATCLMDVRAGGIPNPEEYTDGDLISDVKKYLSRPQQLTSGAIGPSTGKYINSQRVDLPFWARHTHWPKVLGAYAVRATTCFKIVLAQMQYHAGMVRVCFKPFESSPSTEWSFTQLSQMPGIELDFSNGTSIEFRVPFIHEKNFFEINDLQAGVLGSVYFVNYSPVATGTGAQNVPYTIYWWLEDIELIGAFPSVLANDYVQAQQRILDSIPITNQAGLAPQDQEAEHMKISAMLASGSKLAAAGASWLPTLSTILGPTAWFLRMSSKVAASFGYAKPPISNPAQLMKPTNLTYQHNVDGPFVGYNLGATYDTSLKLITMGTDMDEMSFSYPLSIYSRIGIYTVRGSDPSNTTIFNRSLNPALMTGDGAGVVVALTPLSFMANMFQYWRGSFVFRIKAVKTALHAGRVLLGYIPFNEGAVTLPGVEMGLDYKSVVWDLKEDSFMEFECPYVYSEPYRICDPDYETVASVGQFFMKVLDPIRGGTMVADAVNFILEVKASSDFEFAVPSRLRRAVSFTKTPAPVLVNQAGVGEPIRSPPGDFSMECIGNKLLSFKQLLGKAEHIIQVPADHSTVVHYASYLEEALTYKTHSTHAAIYGCYSLWRGGYRAFVLPDSVSAVVTVSTSFDGRQTETRIKETGTSLNVVLPYHSTRSRNIIGPTTTPRGTYTTEISCRGSTADLEMSCGEDFQLAYFACCPYIFP